MALKNTYSKLSAGRYIQDTQDALMKAGASGIALAFEEGRVSGLSFSIAFGINNMQFRLPVNWRNFQKVLKKEQNIRAIQEKALLVSKLGLPRNKKEYKVFKRAMNHIDKTEGLSTPL